MKHTFAICAYKESEYLEECIKSLKNQTVQSYIFITTSTPNSHIYDLAEKYNIEVYVNTGESGITQDWNFALSKVYTQYATIAHQDDVYEPQYTEEVLKEIAVESKPLIAFTDYRELRNGEKISDNTILKIKRMLLCPLKIKTLRRSIFVRRRSLSLGDAICCPSVCFCMNNVPKPVFSHGYRSCEDWEAWEKLSRNKGSFIYIPKPLMCHRIHEDSATTAVLKDNVRVQENYEMYCKFWPKWFATIINRYYTKSEASNTL